MATSSFFPLAADFQVAGSARVSAANVRLLFHRFCDAVINSRQRQLDREIGRLLQGTGGKLTDNLERQIEQMLL